MNHKRQLGSAVGRIFNSGLTWDGTASRRTAVLLIALCIAALLVVSLAPGAQAADSFNTDETTITAARYDSPTLIGGAGWLPAGISYRGVSWS